MLSAILSFTIIGTAYFIWHLVIIKEINHLIPSWLQTISIIIGVLLFLYSTFGMFMIKGTKRRNFFIFTLGGLFLILLSFIVSVTFTWKARLLHSELEQSCTSYMPMLHADYLVTMGCDEKYTTTWPAKEVPPQECEKNKIRKVWEGEAQYDATFM